MTKTVVLRFPGRQVTRDTKARHERQDELRKLREEARTNADDSDADESDPEDKGTVEAKGQPATRAAEEECNSERHMTLVAYMCSMLAAWLNLSGGASCTTSGVMLKAITTILATAFHIISITLLKPLGVNIDIPIPHIPRDVHSTYNTLNIEPTIIRTACCPKCFTLYPLHADLLDCCTWKESPRSRACGAAEDEQEDQERKDHDTKTHI
ncbi:hypothetical protein K435DRAFT_862532 [Dendrothele bispora CBS 962.96]|uniref:Uncharacterized protein n=1 Tax=Dendrothele bispora (strain CBS 962.96) TaxID=1314807 RepID=A0A4S8LTH8_DENBC|nr:hypothetical protein K435DRAFT_862532 [Dendrothele bispora CBS 962.96]